MRFFTALGFPIPCPFLAYFFAGLSALFLRFGRCILASRADRSELNRSVVVAYSRRIKMPFLFAPAMQAVIPVRDSADFFPVRRVYGAAKNYAPDIATCEEKKDLIRRFF